MDSYLLVRAIHVLAAIAMAGPALLAPRWVRFARDETGHRMIEDLHRLTGIAGWLVLISGAVILFMTGWAYLHEVWMQASIAIFLLAQAFDHFWADGQEELVANAAAADGKPLQIWLIAKVFSYFLIALLMVVKPQF